MKRLQEYLLFFLLRGKPFSPTKHTRARESKNPLSTFVNPQGDERLEVRRSFSLVPAARYVSSPRQNITKKGGKRRSDISCQHGRRIFHATQLKLFVV